MDNKIFNLINNSNSISKNNIKSNDYKRNETKDKKFSKVLDKNVREERKNNDVNTNNSNQKKNIDNEQPKVTTEKHNTSDTKNLDKAEKKCDLGLKNLEKKSKSDDENEIVNLLELLMIACAPNSNKDLEKAVEKIENAMNNMFKKALGNLEGKDGNNLASLLKKLNSNIDELLNDSIAKLPIKGNKEKLLLEKAVDSIENKIGDIIKEKLNTATTSVDDNLEFLNQIKVQISKILSGKNKATNKSDDIEKFQQNINDVLENLIKDDSNNLKNQLNQDNNNSNVLSKENNNSKEEDLLKNISGKDKSDKFSNKINFVNQFTNMNKIDTEEIKEAENIFASKKTMATDVIKAVKFMNLNDLKKLTVKINPKELGELVIKITMESGKMKANITANSKDAFNILNANLQDITSKLQDSSIKIENFTLNLYEDTTFFKDKEGSKSREESGSKNHRNGKVISNENIETKENINPLEELNNLSRLA